VQRLASLPDLHKDPFDRMLICQALEQGLTLITVDAAIRAYPVDTLGLGAAEQMRRDDS